MSKNTNEQLIFNYVRNARTVAGSSVAGKVLFGASLLSALLGINSYVQSFAAEKEVEFRKSQLKKPIVKLTEEQLVNPPWNRQNIDTWLYRRVQVVGRPIHRLSCFVPHRQFDQFGYEAVMPLVTRQDKNYQNRQGLLFSLGFVPSHVANVTCRQTIENVSRQKFVCFVSKMDNLKNTSWFQGNAYQRGRLFYTSADLQDFAKSSELLNREQASVAVVERLAETGIYDERSPQRYGTDCHFTQKFPWAKTQSGALQMAKMPWDYRTEAKHYLFSSLAILLVGASVF